MLEIRPVTTRRDRRRFVAFPVSLYRDNPCFVPSLYAEEMDLFDPRTNPALAFCEARHFLALRDGRVVGRVSAILNRRAIEKWAQPRMRFTRLDFVDDVAVSGALLGAVEAFARERRMTHVHGPIGFSDFDKEGMLIEGFDEQSTLITFYNAPYYVAHMIHHGYGKSVDWVEFLIRTPDRPEETAARACAYVMQRMNLTRLPVRNIRRDVLPRAMEIFDLLNQAYSPLYGTIPVSRDEVDMLVRQYFTILRPEYVEVILDEHDRIAAFGLAVPSVVEALRAGKGHIRPWNALPLLRAMYGKHERIELMLIAVRPDLQNRGLNSLLIHNVTCTALKNGVQLAESGPSLESNERMWGTWKRYEARLHRRRRCWIKEV